MITELLTLDHELVLATMLEVVAEKGSDFRYTQPDNPQDCEYAPVRGAAEGDPRRTTGCLVGEVLHRLGVEYDQMRGWSAVGDITSDEWDDVNVAPTPLAEVALTAAQRCQDVGGTWDDAYLRAGVAVTTGVLL